MIGAFDLMEIQKHCEALCAALPLNAIQSENEYELAIEKLNDLLDAGGANENHPLALVVHRLGESISAYEAIHHPLPELPPNEMLRFLMDEHEIKQGDLPEVGSQGVVSEILAGKRKLNARQISLLALRFGVPGGLFL
ncbi:MAG: helix-turn-helix domain-containing protein [Burkholderiales bacterium]